MGFCEMCGTQTTLFKTDIEGTDLNVCKECSKFGKVISVIRHEEPRKKKKKPVQEAEDNKTSSELIQVVSDDYASKIKLAREKMGLKQIELAKKLAERESLIQKMESGQFTPSIILARKLENHLRIKLIEQHEEKHDKKFRAEGVNLTLGDIIEMKK